MISTDAGKALTEFKYPFMIKKKNMLSVKQNRPQKDIPQQSKSYPYNY